MERSFDEICPYIREAGLQHQDSWRNTPRRIYDHQFLYCFMGSAHMVLGERSYSVKKGMLVVIPPNVPHLFWVEDEESELYWFHCDFLFYPDRKWLFKLYNEPEEYMKLFGLPLEHEEHIRENPVFQSGYCLPECLAIENRDQVEYLFRTIYKAYLKHDHFWQLAAKAAFLQLLEEVFNQTCAAQPGNAGGRKVAGQMKRFVAANYYKPITVRQICEETGLHCEYASKRFKEETGMKPVEYLNRYRVGKAKRLMMEADLDLVDIAEMVGFNSVNYFCNVVKKYEGKPPNVLRQSLLELVEE